MSQRNPMNERYTTEHKGGSTRKSAASAKPVTKAASSVRTAPTKPAKKGFFSKKTEDPQAAKRAAKQEKKAEAAQEAKQSQTKEEIKEERKSDRAERRAIQRFVPDTPEFKAANKKRMIYSAIGLGGMLIAIVLSLVVPQQPFLSIGIMVVAWVFFFISVRIDSNQLRPMRERGYMAAKRKAEKKCKK